MTNKRELVALAGSKFPISQDPRTLNQVAAVLLLREIRRIANGEPTEPERRAALRSRATTPTTAPVVPTVKVL